MKKRSFSRTNAWLLALLLAALFLGTAGPMTASDTPDPASVAIAGSLQDELGCSADWQPDCDATELVYDADDDVWQAIFNVPGGDFEYKAPLNDTWDENYGLGAVRGGANIPLSLLSATDVKFYYDHETHWVTDNVNSLIVTAPGDFQEELGCPGDWQPWCLRSWLQDPDADGLFTFTTEKLPAGDYQVKAALDESWDVNYGQGGVQGGSNILFSVADDCAATRLKFDSATNVLSVDAVDLSTPQPDFVTVAGSFQDEVGCPGDWQPDCAVTHLAFDAEDTVWQGTFSIPAGNWEYKAPINNSWDENYGLNATPNGSNIPLSLAAPTDVKFYFSRDTNWITSNQNSVIATVAGSFQDELGCSGDWQPWCLRSWLQDPDGDGLYTFSTSKIPVGNWEVKVAINEAWDENYGEGGVPGGANIQFAVTEPCSEVFFVYDANSHVLQVSTDGGGPQGNLALARGHWLKENLVAWNSTPALAAAEVALYWALDGGMTLGLDGINGGESIPLTPIGALPAEIVAEYPHLAGFEAYQIADADLDLVPEILTGQTAIVAFDGEGVELDANSLQIPGVLDDLYFYDGELGIVWNGNVPTLKLWAPTAKNVTLYLFADADPATASQIVAMERDPNGVWSVTGTADWKWKFFLYEVEVYAPSTGQVTSNLVTDPYSLSLSANSARSQIIDLDDRALQPHGWRSVHKPRLERPEDTVIYELHVRDFSWSDNTVPESLRGTFKAFTLPWTRGMRHLASLALAGLTHVHLLPSFDIATVTERRADQVQPDPALLASYPPDSEEQQAIITAIEDQDGFNWGYDPWHYTVPEGSYATDPDGAARVREFREMVQWLNRIGLRAVMDVVYNHTNAAGQNPKSVLDRVVPGYYHRLNLDGAIETSSCCPNTASEHAMMEKLMIDSVLTWARDYKVDGFRFDLMGHHMLRNMVKLRAALDSLTVASDGVDGPSIALYGEGWNFGEVANNARGVNAIQQNVAGTGIGSFNDRIRDAVRGGGPFSGVQEQGFATGLFNDPNATDQGTPADQEAKLLLHMDQIRVSLSGNLEDFTFTDRFGNEVNGRQVDYNGQEAAYTLDPQEIINYAAAHDNETLFDAVQLKVPLSSDMARRVRYQNLANSLVMLGQGIPFFHAGQDLLRSKSMDRDSFNSGDWFNKLDFSYETNNWGVGLPVAGKNQDKWPLMQPLLADPALTPASGNIEAARRHFLSMLAIRKSTPLFRLETAREVIDRVAFHNTGPGQVPGLIVMSLSDEGRGLDPNLDRLIDRIVVIFNATPDTQEFTIDEYAGERFLLHPFHVFAHDAALRDADYRRQTGTFTVPGLTTVVFIDPGFGR